MLVKALVPLNLTRCLIFHGIVVYGGKGMNL